MEEQSLEELIGEANELLGHLKKDIQISLRLKEQRDVLEDEVTSLTSRENALKKAIMRLEEKLQKVGMEERSDRETIGEFDEDIKAIFSTLREEVELTKKLKNERTKLQTEIEELESKKTEG